MGNSHQHAKHQNPVPFMVLFGVVALAGVVLILAFGDSQGAAGSTDEPVAAQPSEFCPPASDLPFDADEVEGESVEDADEWAADNGYTIRPVVIDGEPQATTMDFNPDRVNVEIASDTVVAVCSMG